MYISNIYYRFFIYFRCEENKKARLWYNQQKIIDSLPIDSRIKSIGSAIIKFDKHYPPPDLCTSHARLAQEGERKEE
ncbi:MAG: hypothetical protein GX053_08085 [Tissierella sp.]|nr:hypothetical protein [Tissierella sp.]